MITVELTIKYFIVIDKADAAGIKKISHTRKSKSFVIKIIPFAGLILKYCKTFSNIIIPTASSNTHKTAK